MEIGRSRANVVFKFRHPSRIEHELSTSCRGFERPVYADRGRQETNGLKIVIARRAMQRYIVPLQQEMIFISFQLSRILLSSTAFHQD